MITKITSLPEFELMLIAQDDWDNLSYSFYNKTDFINSEGFECIVANVSDDDVDSTEYYMQQCPEYYDEQIQKALQSGVSQTTIDKILSGDFKYIEHFYIYTKKSVWGVVDIGYDVLALIAFPRNPPTEIH